jgi:SAM-dependent methyltransferase
MSGPAEERDPAQWADPAPTYDRVAAAYADRFADELDHKAFDREILTRFTVMAKLASGATRPVCDLGCGPGHVGAFLASGGLDVIGIDLSLGMVEQARQRFPAVKFSQGDMTSLILPDQAISGIVCFYALIHIPRPRVALALREMRRVLVDEGPLLIAVHGGEGSLHADEMAGQSADLDVTLFSLSELAKLTEDAGFHVVEAHERAPYEREYPTPRLYLWATRRA